jgi:hypothetical protein
MDVLTILRPPAMATLWWLDFAITVGAIVGGYITCGLARKGGSSFQRKLSKKTAEKVFRRFGAGDF